MTRRPARAAGIEIAAVRALAVAVYAAAAGTSVLAGPGALVLFLPALIGSVAAVRLVRRGALGCAGAEAARRTRVACDNRVRDQGAGGRRP
ncbi:hypothetical protein [Streptomyces sp. CB00072]|uniref:hypothetical protein n=1 Tax=Streptomyces sp. CB00072 TaxID=1703928 RepID=UPI001F518118|nr:hypothetical protein [Streptomyces sp. CB00072]